MRNANKCTHCDLKEKKFFGESEKTGTTSFGFGCKKAWKERGEERAVSGSVVSSTYLTMSRMIMTLLEEEEKKQRLSEITLSPQLLFSSLLSNDPFPQGS